MLNRRNSERRPTRPDPAIEGDGHPAGSVAVAGPARVDRRTKELTKRLEAGDIAVINHEDLDRVAAQCLMEAQVAAVINAAPSLSGRYPNIGPLLLAGAGIPLVDQVGPAILDRVIEGQRVSIDGHDVLVDGVVVGHGVRQDLASLEGEYEAAKRSMGAALERFAANTLEFIREEHHAALLPLDLPGLRATIRGRHVLIVVRGSDYKEDLAHLHSYVREIRPLLVGVDGGADALIEFGLRPDVIVGDFDSVSDRALGGGAELVVHAYPGGGAPGAARLDALGVPYLVLEAAGTSEDVAMLLAYDKGAELIVAVGAHGSMVEFLDKGRAGMASTFLTRLKIGQLLVDAKGVSKLYQSRVRKRDLAAFLLAAMLCFVVVIVTVFPSVFLESFWFLLGEFWRSVTS